MKWLVVLTLAVGALLVLLWMELRAPEAVAAPHAPAPAPVAAPAAAAVPRAPGLAEAVAKVEAANDAPKKVDVSSDEFFRMFDDPQPQLLTRHAAKCYTGGLKRVHRNQKVKLRFTNHIKDGEVFVTDVKVVDAETTMKDPETIACFVREVGKAHWHNDELPDYDAPDELIIRPERGMKKHTAENLSYVGAEKE